jgi:hypothetical protein
VAAGEWKAARLKRCERGWMAVRVGSWHGRNAE